MCYSGLKRTRDQDSCPSPNTVLTKKPKYTSSSIHWNSNLSLNYVDRNVLIKLLKAITQSIDTLCLDIAKEIAEYSLGWIKLCPTCIKGEVLIIPSFISDVDHCDSYQDEIDLQCSDTKCTQNCYIHLCDECPLIPGKPLNDYFSIGWWLHSESMSDTKYIEQPMNSSCRICVDLYGVSKELCVECTYLCSGCGNKYCTSAHLDYHCIHCNRNLCQYCFSWMINHPKDASYQAINIIEEDSVIINSKTLKSCINCFYKLDVIHFANINHISNFKDRYQFYVHVQSLMTLPISLGINTCSIIAQYSVGLLLLCQQDGCDAYFHAMYSDLNYFITPSFHCDANDHENYVHYCDLCKCQYWVNTIPSYYTYQNSDNRLPISLVGDHPYQNWTSSVYDSRRPNICKSHMEGKQIFKLCHDCSFKCNGCDGVFCVSGHMYFQCDTCSKKYCCQDWRFHMTKCLKCNKNICNDCCMMHSVSHSY